MRTRHVLADGWYIRQLEPGTADPAELTCQAAGPDENWLPAPEGEFAAFLQNCRIERRLEKRGYPSEAWPLGFLSAILLLLIGIYGFVVVLTNP